MDFVELGPPLRSHDACIFISTDFDRSIQSVRAVLRVRPTLVICDACCMVSKDEARSIGAGRDPFLEAYNAGLGVNFSDRRAVGPTLLAINPVFF